MTTGDAPVQATAEPDLATLRRRLIAMRQELVADLGIEIEGGTLALLGSVNSAVAAIEAELVIEADPADRAIVSDDGEAILLTVYAADRRAAAATLTRHGAVRLAGRLITAASRILATGQ